MINGPAIIARNLLFAAHASIYLNRDTPESSIAGRTGSELYLGQSPTFDNVFAEVIVFPWEISYVDWARPTFESNFDPFRE